MNDHVIREWEDTAANARLREQVWNLDFEKFFTFARNHFFIGELRKDEDCWLMGQGRSWAIVRRELSAWLGNRPAFGIKRHSRQPYYYKGFGHFISRCPKNESCIRPSHQEIMNIKMEILP